MPVTGETKALPPTTSQEDIRQMVDEARQSMLTRGLSRSLSHALRRGETLAEKKSAWPFDFYQATNIFPVDYKYYTRPYQTDCGPSTLVTMHAHAYTAEGEEFAADQVYHRASMREAHRKAITAHIMTEKDPRAGVPKDKWIDLRNLFIGTRR